MNANVIKLHPINGEERQCKVDVDGTPVFLTQREVECLYFLIHGKTAKQCAIELGLSYRTVESHLQRTKMKLMCQTKYQLAAKVARLFEH